MLTVTISLFLCTVIFTSHGMEEDFSRFNVKRAKTDVKNSDEPSLKYSLSEIFQDTAGDQTDGTKIGFITNEVLYASLGKEDSSEFNWELDKSFDSFYHLETSFQEALNLIDQGIDSKTMPEFRESCIHQAFYILESIIDSNFTNSPLFTQDQKDKFDEIESESMYRIARLYLLETCPKGRSSSLTIYWLKRAINEKENPKAAVYLARIYMEYPNNKLLEYHHEILKLLNMAITRCNYIAYVHLAAYYFKGYPFKDVLSSTFVSVQIKKSIRLASKNFYSFILKQPSDAKMILRRYQIKNSPEAHKKNPDPYNMYYFIQRYVVVPSKTHPIDQTVREGLLNFCHKHDIKL